ncbi:NIPSNAP family protein [Nonomuraea sp. NPDC048916]|uniref:NIPSNAP family protein n=1 Tax=Nonomuraea sp. NPDC048916 TaxID=3154232 RepID=UPI0033F12DCC
MIYELRQYTMRPGRRDTLIELFEREFIEAQEDAGMGVVAQFRDLDSPDLFSWIRKFPDMESRRLALTAFYGGPVWKANRDAANATMIDSDDVLLLRPAAGAPAPFAAADRPDRPPIGAGALPSSRYVATIYHVGEGFSAFFADRVLPALAEAGVSPVACLESEHAANTFPALPVRTGENVFVWFARFDRAEDEHDVPLPMLADRLTAPPQRLRLAPTARSALR